jgi:hypothetical protein
MAAITDLSNIVQLLTNGSAQHPSFFADNRIGASAATTPVSAQHTSLWRYNKTNGANGAVPTTVDAPTRATLGAMGQNNAAGGKELWLLGMEATATASGVLVMYDRLLHIGGLSGTTTTAQSVGGAITRNTGGVGNEIWIEVNTAIGATATTIAASYTNQAGATKTTPAVAIGGTGLREGERMIRLPLADGDTGVQGVISVTLAASTATAGNFGVVIAKPMARGMIEAAGCAAFRDFIGGTPAILKIVDDACVAFAWLASAATAPRLDIGLHMVEK